MLGSLRMLSLQERDTARDFIFEEEYVDILIGVIGIDQGFILDFIQYTTDQDNIREFLIQEVAPEEQTLPPQNPIPLKRSTRERRSALPNDYIIFPQEHEVDIGMIEDDLINFYQAMKIYNS